MELTDGIFWYREFSPMGDCNKYVIDDELLILVDPGNPRFLSILSQEMRQDGLTTSDVRLVVNTHCHPDHCGANEEIRRLTGAKIAAHPAELDYIEEYRSISALLDIKLKFDLDVKLSEGTFPNGSTLLVLHTPGHSAGSICLHCGRRKFLICGDLLFEGGIGRIDLPGGNISDLRNSLERISKLSLDYLLPGHGRILRGSENIARNFVLAKHLIHNL